MTKTDLVICFLMALMVVGEEVGIGNASWNNLVSSH